MYLIRNERNDLEPKEWQHTTNAISIADNSVHNLLKNMPAFNSTFLLDNKQKALDKTQAFKSTLKSKL